MITDKDVAQDLHFLRHVQKKRPGVISPAYLFSHIKTLKIAKWLCDIGVNVNGADVHGTTPLMVVENPAVFKFLLKRGGKLSVQDNFKRSPWGIAAKHPELLKAALATGEKPIDEALVVAAKYSYENTKLLLKKKLNVNVTDILGCTPLFAAEDLETMRLLIKEKADVNIQDNSGNTALMNAANRSVEETQLLLESGALVNIQNNEGTNALMLAVNGDIMNLLLRAGADTKSVNILNETALHALVGFDEEMTPSEYVRMAQMLVEYECPVDHKNDDGDTALDKARKSGDFPGRADLIAFLEQYETRGICVAKRKAPSIENDKINTLV